MQLDDGNTQASLAHVNIQPVALLPSKLCSVQLGHTAFVEVAVISSCKISVIRVSHSSF